MIIITVNLQRAYFVRNLNRTECAIVEGEEERFQTAFEGRERERLMSVKLIASEFQMVGPAYANARASYVDSLVRGKSRWSRSAERQEHRRRLTQ